MPTVSKSLYDRMIENRPLKFGPEEVHFRESEGDEKCETCIHCYTRKVDKFHTCEIYRPSDDSSVDDSGVCDFHSVDGESFPLLDS